MEPSKRRKTTHEVGLMRNGGFVGSASGIHFIRTVYGTADAIAPDLVPGEDDALQPSKSIWLPQEVSDATFTFNDLVTWTSSYFENWHPCFPCLHAPSILAAMEKYPAIDTYDTIILKSIMSISLADSRQTTGRSAPKELLFDTFDAALEGIQPVLVRPPTLKSLQAILAVQMFLISMLRLNVASRIGGLIVRMAYQLGLHRCPTRFSTFTAEENSMRRRTFYSMYCLERIIAHALGLPLAIRDDDIDVCDLEKEEHGATPPIDDRLKMLTLLARHARIRGSIMELRNKNVPQRDKSVDTATLISAKIKHWWNEVDDFLELGTASTLQRTVLTVLRNECIITLNRPLLALPKTSANYAAGLQSCITAARAIIGSLHDIRNTLVWPSFTWATWMSSFILIYAAFEGQVTQETAIRLTERAGKIFEGLALRGSVWPDACAMAIERLRRSLTERATPSQDFGTTMGFAIPQTPQQLQDYDDALHSTTDIDQDGHLAPGARPQVAVGASSGLHSDTQPDMVSQQWQEGMNASKELPPYAFNEFDPFQGFDIPFWVGQDHYAAWSANM